ncbi:MAG: glycosyltransferase [Chloroflexi bacterium]|nr:glycosyltransferase [Chloroflexota bacterium]
MPGIRLWLAGSGALQSDDVTEELHQAAAHLGVADKVRFLGAVSDVEQVLQAADLFVFPSHREGMPNALIEAVTCGLPVIASDIDGVRDVVGDEHIRFFPTGDTQALADAVLDAFASAQVTAIKADRARNHVEATFSLSSVASRYEAVYRALILNESLQTMQTRER